MNGFTLKSRLLASSVFAGAAFGLMGMHAYAQEDVETVEAADDAEAVQQTVFVTGSRIAQTNFDSPVPVSQFNSEEIELTGAINTAEILRTLPAAGVSGLTTTNSNFFTQASGINSVELRNLSEDRTLVLVNGRRFVSGVPGAQTVDFNSIPTEFIERVDVVTGGASSVYGSDALAGVVNVVLRDNFDGVVASFQGGISDYEDNENFRASTTFGTDFADGRGNALASVTWSKENGVFARDRGEQNRATDGLSGVFFGQPFSDIVTPFYSSFSERGRIIVPGNLAPADGSLNPRDQNSVVDEATGEVRDFVSANADGSPLDGFNRQGFRALAVPLERLLFSSVMNYEINPHANVFFEGTFATTDSGSELEPFPLSSEDIFGDQAAQFVDTDGDGFSDATQFGISILNPFVPDALAQRARDGAIAQAEAEQLIAACIAAGLNVDADGMPVQLTPANCNTTLVTPGAPVVFADEDLVVGFARRTTELDQRGASNTRQTARFVLGLDGDIPGTETWAYETSFNWGRTTQSQQSTGQVNVLNFRNALNVETLPDGTVQCADEIARAQGCVPVNIFGVGTISPEAAAYLRAPSSVQAQIEQIVLSGFVSGELGFTSPSANDPFRAVFGAEYREESSESVPDALSQVGLNAGNISPIVEGSFDVAEAFAELELPLVQDRPGVQELSLNLSARLSEYSTVGDTFAWSANAQYSPIDMLRFRAQYAEAVRAPNIGELFQPLSETFEGGDDPCEGTTAASTGDTAAACLADPAVAARVARDGIYTQTQPELQGIGGFNGGNPNLGEESAETITFGVVFTPDFGNDWIDNFGVSVDYYDIQIEDAIAGLGRQTSLDECYENSGGVFDPNSVFCTNIVRFQSGPSIGAIDELNAVQQNLASLQTSGIDVQASYLLPLNDVFANTELDLGELTGTVTYGWLETWEQTPFPGAEPLEFAGVYGTFEHEALIGLVYRRGGLTVAYDANWLPESDVERPTATNPNPEQVPSVTFQDVQVRYAFDDLGLELIGGVDNLTDEFVSFGGFPFEGQTGTFTDAAVYDSIGRRFYAGVRMEF